MSALGNLQRAVTNIVANIDLANSMLTDLKAQLENAVGNGSDPALVQTLSDQLDAANTALASAMATAAPAPAATPPAA